MFCLQGLLSHNFLIKKLIGTLHFFASRALPKQGRTRNKHSPHVVYLMCMTDVLADCQAVAKHRANTCQFV